MLGAPIPRSGRPEGAHAIPATACDSVSQKGSAIINEHDRVVLLSKIESARLEPGDFGTVVHVYPRGDAYEVEFVALDGTTAAVEIVKASDVRAVRPREITHAREVSAA
jgi:hypothetical protein